MARTFDWETDCGTQVSPRDAVDAARTAGQTFKQYAQQYKQQWPFSEKPPRDLVNGMVADMEFAADMLDNYEFEMRMVEAGE